MASHTAGKAAKERQKQLYEGKREREFYRYYQPIRELTKAGPPLCDLADAHAVRAHRPFSSPDRALTAFCQLGALRLETRRAMLFFFDSNYAYVLAEATRTLSLQNDSVMVQEDDLWLGHTVIPRGFSVCEHTVNLPSNQGSNKDDPTSSGLIHIVNDLSDDTRFCDRPFVTGEPNARFYAGVPITTPRGINIGAYCVLDDKKREGLSTDGMNFMRDMAATVMTHLEMVRATAEHKIGTQMIAGLGAFIDGASGFRDWAAQNGDFGLDKDPHLSHPMKVQPMTANASAVAQAAVQVGEHIEEERRTSTVSSSPRRQRSRGATMTNSHLLQPSAKSQATLKNKRSAERFDPDPAAVSAQKTFERAATLLREAMSIDGVLFLDAAHSSDCHGSGAEATTGTEGEEKLTRKPGEDANRTRKLCHILASAAIKDAEVGSAQETHFNGIKKPEEMTERFLRSLLRRYPRGKIWSFNEYGDASSEDESSEYNTDTGSCRCSRNTRPSDLQGHKILRLLPGVRSVGLVGMWDHTRQRWYAASIFWSYSPLRLFSEESEVKYMQAFCDVILAELHRLEAQNSDRAKSDFISTISHELRSPLHGILGSVECLQEQETDSFSVGLISQIEICGRTLLDIIDHLLDFSKINHQARSKNGALADAQGRRLSSTGKRIRMGGMMALDTDAALDHVTEEVVETTVYSFCCSRDAEMIMNRKVAVILDIDRSPDVDWKCHIALGAWKRVCINLVSNALKYTSSGHIRVSLRASPIPDKRKRFHVTFTVADSGRGMSRDFLENQLFRAFAQEDSLVEGTGLGMNLVAKIVKAWDGRIEVQSEKGVGSSFSITLPLERSRSSSITVGVIDNTSTPLASGNQVPDETARSLLLQSVHHTLAQVGVNAAMCAWAGEEKADMYFVTEGELSQELQRRQDMGCTDILMSPSALSNKPFIVLCDSTLSARRIRAPGLGNIATGYVELVAQPAGPDRLAKAIHSCLKHRDSVNKIQAVAGTLKDVPAVVSHPEPSTVAHSIPIRPRKDTHIGSPTGDKTKDDSPNRSGDEHAVTQEARSAELERGLAKPNSGVSLLLVDDNPINLQLLVTYAEKFGHRKTVATDGQQAVDAYKTACLEGSASSPSSDQGQKPEMVRNDSGNDSSQAVTNEVETLQTSKPNVILMDINMPCLNGFEATRQIRGFEKMMGIEPATIIALTGLGSASAQQEAFSSGFDMFLTKPVRLKELTKILDGIKRP
ncbi:Hybrid signal transduction histidine kinase B [Lecanosticta acicola]|uniref:histidine kinase n=1 Tax=Lecanosticta acicola TaxID=111012 RepID=A0AAI8YVZ2_9PEZI|nr:Hybrid signal transduction histidine kinase B [Lecanosticta acicola]